MIAGSRKQEQLAKLYERYIEDHWAAAPAMRNEFVIRAIPFLYSAVCESAALWIAMNFFDLHHQLFKDSRDTHEYSAKRHYDNVARRYHKRLKANERRVYDRLSTENKKTAFRICKALAERRSIRNEFDDGEFILSGRDLADRLLIEKKGGDSLLGLLQKDGVIGLVKKGLPWQPGVQPTATRWCYLL